MCNTRDNVFEVGCTIKITKQNPGHQSGVLAFGWVSVKSGMVSSPGVTMGPHAQHYAPFLLVVLERSVLSQTGIIKLYGLRFSVPQIPASRLRRCCRTGTRYNNTSERDSRRPSSEWLSLLRNPRNRQNDLRQNPRQSSQLHWTRWNTHIANHHSLQCLCTLPVNYVLVIGRCR